jgi:hypothetical protein
VAAFHLPIEYASTVTQLLRLYKAWSKGQTLTRFMLGDVQSIFCTVMNHTRPVFTVLSGQDPDAVAAHPPQTKAAPQE